jgi:HEAT repeat protein
MKAVPPLIGVLEDTDAGARAGAVESLGRLKDNRSITPLIKHLRDPEVNVRGEAGRALVAIGKPGEEALISALKDGDNTTRAGVAVVLGEIGDERSTEPLLLAFQNGDRNVRHAAVIALAKIDKSRALQPFVQILQDPSAESDIRADAAWGLGEMNDIKARGPLLQAMAVDKDDNVRLSAAKALKNIGGVSIPVYSI